MESTEVDSRRAVTQLVKLNLSVTALLLIACFVVVNLVVAFATYRSIDSELDYQLSGFVEAASAPAPDFTKKKTGMRPIVYLDLEDGSFVNPYLSSREVIAETEAILTREIPAGCSSQTVGEETYRVMKLSFVEPRTFYSYENPISPVVAAVLLRNISSEYEILVNTRIASAVCALAILALFVLFNYRFSRQAVIPIKKALDAQMKFASDTSHQLRNPLSVIRANADLLQAPSLGKEVRGRLSEAISRNADDMDEMLDDLLTISRSSSTQLTLGFERLDMALILKKMAENYKCLASVRGIRFVFEQSGEMPMLGNRELLEKLFGALLDNALSYTNGPGTVRLESITGGGSHRIKVIDEGIGISSEDLGKVTERFYRAKNAIAANPRGTGLGIPIAMEIASQHNAEMRIDSKLGQGTEVTIVFPAARRR